MLTTVVVAVTFLLALALLAFSKQDLLKQRFSNQLAKPANDLQDQLELTADTVIKNLEGHIVQLESLLAEADHKMEKMGETIRQSESKLTSMGQALSDTDKKMNELDEKISEAKVVNTVLANTQKTALMQLAKEDLSLARNRVELQEAIPLYQVRETEQKLSAQPEPLEKVVPYAFNQYQHQRETSISAPASQETEAVTSDETVNQPQAVNSSEPDTRLADALAAEQHKASVEQDIAKLDQSIQQQRPVVLAMAQQGYTVTEISKVTGLGKGEILLFLELNKTS
ncbi:MAG: hypothetical protein E6713_17100 [Sporomusaceae bacterium]|nr:hypothetical protein [Sporomusaceae bacterium]